ncbi:MAG: rod shape-determining protein MreC [Eubacteriales bacterium]|nr:rod shape-determining protein MreC [Eubacteriales bacterium]
MKWYREHIRLTIISIVLFLLFTLTVVSYLHQGSNSWLGSQIERVNVFIQEPVSDGGNGLADTVKGLFLFKRVMAENRALEDENAELKREVIKQALSREELAELRDLNEALNHESFAENQEYVTAAVVAMDGSQWYRIFTINAGSEKGIHKDDIVINAKGLVGRILDVGPKWSKVISIIDEKNDVSFQVFRKLDLLGVLTGDGKGGLTGYMLDVDASVIEGDVLITSGMELYPQGIPIGKISKVSQDKDALLQTVEVEPAVEFTSIQKVTVILSDR